MGGAAQNISIADMFAFEVVCCDDEALEAREVTDEKWKEFRKRVLFQVGSVSKNSLRRASVGVRSAYTPGFSGGEATDYGPLLQNTPSKIFHTE
jgi:hypothetical protein